MHAPQTATSERVNSPQGEGTKLRDLRGQSGCRRKERRWPGVLPVKAADRFFHRRGLFFFVGTGSRHTQIRGSMQIAAEFERLQTLIQHEPGDTMPQSVRTRYEQRFNTLRDALRSESHFYPWGAILVSIGAVTDEQLNRALHVQSQPNTPKLLGEFLVEMNVISHDKLAHALTIQRSAPSTCSQIP
jgi:hypothetical protein